MRGGESMLRRPAVKSMAGIAGALYKPRRRRHSSCPATAHVAAIERVTGTLAGRAGSFMLHHTATMTRGALDLRIAVVPDSGTGELAGIDGTMHIDIAGGTHSYRFDYRIAGSP